MAPDETVARSEAPPGENEATFAVVESYLNRFDCSVTHRLATRSPRPREQTAPDDAHVMLG